MAALALPQTRSFFSAFVTAATSAPTLLSWQNLAPLLDLLPPIVLAVPKSKVSHSRKSMRSANKGLKDKHNVVHCPACGEAKLAHHACRSCYDTIIARSRHRKPSSGADRALSGIIKAARNSRS